MEERGGEGGEVRVGGRRRRGGHGLPMPNHDSVFVHSNFILVDTGGVSSRMLCGGHGINAGWPYI